MDPKLDSDSGNTSSGKRRPCKCALPVLPQSNFTRVVDAGRPKSESSLFNWSYKSLSSTLGVQGHGFESQIGTRKNFHRLVFNLVIICAFSEIGRWRNSILNEGAFLMALHGSLSCVLRFRK